MERATEAGAEAQKDLKSGKRVSNAQLRLVCETAKRPLEAGQKAVENGGLTLTDCLRVLQKDPNVFRVLVTGVPSTYSTAEDLVGFLFQLRKQLERLVTKEVKDVTKVRVRSTVG